MCLAPPYSPTQGAVSHPIGTELLMDLPHEIWATKWAGVTSDPYTYEQTARAALLAPLLPMPSPVLTWLGHDLGDTGMVARGCFWGSGALTRIQQ